MIFVDTGFFYALAAEDDPDHERVREVFGELDPKRLSQLCITTNHVVFETVTLTRSLSGYREAVSMGRRLYKERLARIHWATPEEEKKAFDYLVQHQDKGYSAVDCLSFRLAGGPNQNERNGPDQISEIISPARAPRARITSREGERRTPA